MQWAIKERSSARLNVSQKLTHEMVLRCLCFVEKYLYCVALPSKRFKIVLLPLEVSNYSVSKKKKEIVTTSQAQKKKKKREREGEGEKDRLSEAAAF